MNKICAKCSKENAQYRCSACHQANYCSKECQKSDWTEHKQTCLLKTQQVVVVEGTFTRDEAMTRSELNSLTWEVCQVPTMLGVGLKVARLSPSHSYDCSREVGIFMMVEPETGLAPPRWQVRPFTQPTLGTLVFARTDNADFSSEVFWQLYDYIFGTLMDIYSDFGGEAAKNKINLQSFARFVQTRLTETLVFSQ